MILIYSKASRDVSRRIRWAVEVALGLIGLCLVWQVQPSLSFYPFLKPFMLLIAVCSGLNDFGRGGGAVGAGVRFGVHSPDRLPEPQGTDPDTGSSGTWGLAQSVSPRDPIRCLLHRTSLY